MTPRGEVLLRKRRQLRLVCLFVLPLVVCVLTGANLWKAHAAGAPFEIRDVLVGVALIGWSLVVYVIGGALLNALERIERKRRGK